MNTIRLIPPYWNRDAVEVVERGRRFDLVSVLDFTSGGRRENWSEEAI